MLRFLSSAVIVYIMVCVAVYVMQRRLVYFPTQNLPNPQHYQVVKLKTKDDLTLTAWYQSAESGQPTLIYLHGNGGNIAMRDYYAKPYLKQGMGVLLVEYRGYGDNPGKPSEQGLYLDADAAYDFIRAQGIEPNCIILYGESLGCAVAIELATKQSVAALILQAPFTSLPDAGQAHYPYLPVQWLTKDRYDSLSKISQLNVPIVIVHGSKDNVVPFKQGRKLFEAANNPKVFFKQDGYDHNNMNSQKIADDALPFLTDLGLIPCQPNPN